MTQQLAPDDRRGAPRFALLLRAAKLIGERGEYLCILRDVSATGIRLRLFHPLPATDRLWLELASGAHHAIEPAWQSGDHAGFRFRDGPLDPAPLLHDLGPFPRRGLRLQVDLPALIRARDGEFPARLRNVSLSGLGFTCERGFMIDQPLHIQAAPFPLMDGRVRWRRAGVYGLSLDRGFTLDELARLLAYYDGLTFAESA